MTEGWNPYEAPRAGLVEGPGRGSGLESVNRWLLWPLAATAAFPLAVLSLPYAFAIRASIFLGHWPYYGHPDPKDLPDQFDPPEILQLVIPGSVFIISAGLIALVIWSVSRPRRRLVASISIVPASWLLAIGLFLADPAGVMVWIID